MRLLPTFQSLTPALPETLAALDPDLLPQDTLHQLAQAEPT